MHIKSHLNTLITEPVYWVIFIVLVLLFLFIHRELKNSFFNRWGLGFLVAGVLASFYPPDEMICVYQESLLTNCEIEYSAAYITLISISYILVSLPCSIAYYVSNEKEKRLENIKKEQDKEKYKQIERFHAMDIDELEKYFENEATENKNQK